MRRGSFTVLLTIAVIVMFTSAVMVYGMYNAESKDGSAGYYESLNENDWSGACPAAGCRNND